MKKEWLAYLFRGKRHVRKTCVYVSCAAEINGQRIRVPLMVSSILDRDYDLYMN